MFILNPAPQQASMMGYKVTPSGNTPTALSNSIAGKRKEKKQWVRRANLTNKKKESQLIVMFNTCNLASPYISHLILLLY
jgi:hypothetical protein